MGAVSHNLTVEDLGVAMWALDAAPRFGLTFHWSDGVRVRGWSGLAPHERAPFELYKPAIRALLTPDASGRAGLDYIRALGPAPEETVLKPALADKIAAAALDHRGDPATREIAWRKLYDGGALKPIAPRLPPPPPKAEPAPDYSKPGWNQRAAEAARQARAHEAWREAQRPQPKPSKPPPKGFEDWSEAWSYFRNMANWHGSKGQRTTTMFGFRVSVRAEPPRDKWAPPRWGWFVEAPNGVTIRGKNAPHEATALGRAWKWMRSVWPTV
jgi:hypothetical protein